MIAVDTNVLVYAHRQHLSNHARALRWLQYLAESVMPWGIPVFCLGEFVRVATHPRILAPPSTLAETCGALEGLLRSPSVRILSPGANFAALLFEALREADARGNVAFDAQIAAVCREHGAMQILTHDRDFTRFSGLRVVSTEETPGKT